MTKSVLPGQKGKGCQKRQKVAVEDWKEFKDALPDNSLNKNSTTLQGTVLKFRLYSQTCNQCCKICREQLRSDNGIILIPNAVYRRNFTFAVSEAFEGFSTLFDTRSVHAESLKSFQTRFFDAVSKINLFSSAATLR